MKLGGILNFECWGLGNEEPKEVTWEEASIQKAECRGSQPGLDLVT